jgi:hypothetical protein
MIYLATRRLHSRLDGDGQLTRTVPLLVELYVYFLLKPDCRSKGKRDK